MNPLKILLVEDETIPQNAFKNDVEVFKGQPNNPDVKYEIVDNVNDAVKTLDVLYDGAIIDLRLGDNDEGGKEIIQILYNEFTKIPIIVVTGLPDLVVDHPSIIKHRSSEVGSYRDDLLLFQQIRDIGLTHIIGRRGLIEEHLREVFLENLLPQIDTWIRYGKTYNEIYPKRTEKALLRYTLNHLLQLLEEDEEHFFPEEFYLYPPMSKEITTGSIVKEKTSDQLFVVLSPACDLVIRRSGEFKTDRILLVETEKEKDIVDEALTEIKKMSNNRRKKEKIEERVEEVFKNNYTLYYHWLPKTDFFQGRFLNFRKLTALNKDDLKKKFEDPLIQISPSFVKDIVARFSSFYARQGQPDVEMKNFITAYVSHYTTQQEQEV